MSHRILALTLGLSALLLQDASAFAPQSDVSIDIEPQRVMHFHPQAQASFLRSEAWKAFTAGEGQDWMARFDEETGTPHRMWGRGIVLGPTSTPSEVEAGLYAFVERNYRLLGVEAGTLRTRSVNYEASNDTWYVDLDVLAAGAPIYYAGITARIKAGKLVMLGADTYPGVPVANSVVLSSAEADNAAIAGGPAPTSAHTERSVELVSLPQYRDDALVLVQAWMTRSRTAKPVGIWVTMVDAETGELLNIHNEVRHIDGSLYAEHDDRTVNGDTRESPLAGIRVANSNGDFVYADEFGEFSLDGDDITATLKSDYLQVINFDGDNASLPVGPENAHPTFAGTTDSEKAELASYVFLHEVREWGLQFAPNVGWVANDIRTKVNQDSACNAWYDGVSVNFLRQGFGCNNTARIADVNYHEWGHGFHDYSIQSGYFDGSLSEGASDAVAFMLTGHHVIAPYFNQNGSGIREVASNQRYPQDFSASADMVHFNGLIFGGSMWDLWHILEDEGHDDAWEVTSQLLADSLKGGPTIETSFDEVFFSDDDDGDLANGTPHECEIIEAFGQHGLGPLGGSGALVAGHTPLLDVPAGTDIGLNVEMVSPAPNCFSYDPTDAVVTWRVNGGDWSDLELDIDDIDVSGAIPGQKLGDFVEYFIEVQDASGVVSRAPSGGSINPYSFYVGDVLQVNCNDFEDDDGGYTHELLAGENVEGADDWQWGRPGGLSGDPSQAASGNRVWGNDLGVGDYNGAYQDSRHNRLTSSEIGTRHYQDSFLRYQRWLNVEDGVYDQARIMADDELVWDNHASPGDHGEDHHTDNQWAPHVVPLQGLADDGKVTLSWEIQSDGGLSFGGWNIDDVCIFAPATADNRLGIADFEASEGQDGGVVLTWTQPMHDPVEKVRVVRSLDGLPTGANDGDIVYESTDIDLAARVEHLDGAVTPGVTYYYAVYGFDGEDWLSWTIEGWNADSGNGFGDGSADAGGDGKAELNGGRGCGCASTAPAAPIGWLVLGVVGLIGARRR